MHSTRARFRFATLGLLVLSAAACGKASSESHAAAASGTAGSAAARETSGDLSPAFLTKEEVSAIIGSPVTGIEKNSRSHVVYKTADPYLETGIELERTDSTADAKRKMQAARKVTGFVGGKSEEAAGLGDDAFFGAMSLLYVRKGNVVIEINPPNLAQVAQMQAYQKMVGAIGTADSQKAAEEFQKTMKGDPKLAGLAEGDTAKATQDTVAAMSQPQGTEYEARARAMAREMAKKVLARLG